MAETIAPNSGTWKGSFVRPDGETNHVTMTLQANAGTISGNFLITGDTGNPSEVTGSYTDVVQITAADPTETTLTGTIQALEGQAQVLFGTASVSTDGASKFVGICALYSNPSREAMEFAPAWDDANP